MRALAPLLLLAACCGCAGGAGDAAAAALPELGAAPLRSLYPPASGALPPELLTRGVANLGRSARTAALLAKLRRAEPVTLLVLGGSVTNRHAGCTDALVRCANNVSAGDGACCGLVEVREPEAHAARGAGWARLFLDYLVDTWPPAPPGRHRLFNAGVVASGNAAEPFLHCWLGRLPARFDLALLETRVQDSHDRPGGTDVALEHLVRALLRHGGGAPVVALTPGFNWCHGPAWSVPSADHVCRAHPALNKTATSLYTPFPAARNGGGFEDGALTLAQYYNLPATSQRNALFTYLASNSSNWTLPRDTSDDGPHPAPPLQRVMADILVHWWRLLALTHAAFDEPFAADANAEAATAPLPPPVTALTYITRACYGADSGLRALAAPGAVGFEWSDDAARAGKWGYEATAADATVAFRVSSRPPAGKRDAGEAAGDARATQLVGVQLLHTSVNGGAARLTCEGGCACEAMTVDCAADAFSLPRTHHVNVTAAEACVVRVTVARAGRVKVTGITLGASLDGVVPQPSATAQYVQLAPEAAGGDA